MLNIKRLIGCMVVVASMLISCAKSDSYDIKGETDVKFFVRNTVAGNLPENSIGYEVVNIPDVAGSGLVNLSTTIPDAIKFPVYATKPVSEDVVIGAELDNSLIAKYNSSHKSNYAAFPEGILNTGGLTALLSKGATVSADSITIPANLANIISLTGEAYMAPIKLTTVSKPNIGGITNNTTTQVIYIAVNVEVRRIKYSALASEAQGSLISPRSSWDVVLTPDPVMVGSVIDGSTSTYSRWGTSPGQVDVNMQDTKNVTGIRLFTYNSTSRLPTQVEVYLSSDGINYDKIGAPVQANITYSSNYNYILFYKPIAARYVRLVLYYSTSTSTQNRRLAELDVYAN